MLARTSFSLIFANSLPSEFKVFTKCKLHCSAEEKTFMMDDRVNRY